MSLTMIESYLRPKICAKCNGDCCKQHPGSTSPKDFGEPLLDNLIKAFKTGKWAIDWWEGDPRNTDILSRACFVRPAIKGHKELYHPTWGGECVFFAENVGCELSVDDRPSECRMLEPKKNGCVQHGSSKQDCAIAWIPYADIIRDAAEAVS